MWDQLLNWDQEFFIYLNGLGVEKYDLFWTVITQITTWIPLFLLFILLFFLKFPKKEAFFQVLTVSGLVLFVTGITYWAKFGVKRLRPCNEEAINSFIRILKTPQDFSFFSGHASSSFAITTLMFLLLRNKIKWSWIFVLWPLLFSCSRIYVGVHYPLDILVGAIVGLLSGILFYFLYHRIIVPYTR